MPLWDFHYLSMLFAFMFLYNVCKLEKPISMEKGALYSHEKKKKIPEVSETPHQ